MFLKKGRSDWSKMILVAVFAGAVGGGLISYINDTVWQVDSLTQTVAIKKPVIAKEASEQISEKTELSPVVTAEETEATPEIERDFFASFSAGPGARSDAQTREAALKIYREQEDCLKTNFTTFDMNECLIAAGKSYNELLESRYVRRLASLDDLTREWPDAANYYESEKANLKKAMDAWKIYREAICAAEYDDAAGGTIKGIAYGSCYISTTLKQIFSL
ncbi:MAG: DUF1311 domain-containing protein [Candidatus Pacebacteria bacterium]|jgi:uncharacterized protein YecT (DUF1311 family)|nr:DUF1311 domain-containing protein [Candidatus Paceibacterota bacterium]